MPRSVILPTPTSPRRNIKAQLTSQRTVRALAFFNGTLLAPCLAPLVSARRAYAGFFFPDKPFFAFAFLLGVECQNNATEAKIFYLSV